MRLDTCLGAHLGVLLDASLDIVSPHVSRNMSPHVSRNMSPHVSAHVSAHVSERVSRHVSAHVSRHLGLVCYLHTNEDPIQSRNRQCSQQAQSICHPLSPSIRVCFLQRSLCLGCMARRVSRHYGVMSGPVSGRYRAALFNYAVTYMPQS